MTTIQAFAELGKIWRTHVLEFAAVDMPDAEVRADVLAILETEIGPLDSITELQFDPDTETFTGQASQRISLARSQVYSFTLTPDRMSYRLVNAADMAEYAESDEGFAEIADFAAKSGKAGKKLNCKPGNMQCGGKCQSGKLNCYANMTPAQKKAAQAAAKKGKQFLNKKQASPSDTTLLKSALESGDYNEVLNVADRVYAKAKADAEAKGWDFYKGISAGNGSESDAILTELFRSAGYNGKPQLVNTPDFDQETSQPGVRVLYRAPTANAANVQTRFNDFTQGDEYAGRKGIYGHGSYVAMADGGNKVQRRSASEDASDYGSRGMRMILPASARVIDHTQMELLYNRQKQQFDAWVNNQKWTIPQAQQREFTQKVRRAREVLFGDWDAFQGSQRPPASGRLATIMGYDAIHLTGAYNSRYALLLNRSILKVDENIVDLGRGQI